MTIEKKMKAAVLYAPADLRIEEVPIPSINDDEVLVKVRSVGVCGSDIPRVMVTGTYHFPTIPGHEFSGEVVGIGKKVGNYKVGDRVACAPLMPCGKCEMCTQGYFGQCIDYNFLGSRTDGAFAEYVKVPEKNLIHLTDETSFEEGAMFEPAAVTMHGLYKLKLQGGESVAVFGCGAIGLMAIAELKALGAGTVIAIDIDETKFDLAKKMGADIVINSLHDDPIVKIHEIFNRGTDCAVEIAGVSITQEQCLRAVKDHGKILYLGTAHKDVVFPPLSFERIVRGEIELVGSWNSYSSPFPGNEWSDVNKLVTEKKMDIESLITHTFTIDDIPQVIKDMSERKYKYIKVLFKMGD